MPSPRLRFTLPGLHLVTAPSTAPFLRSQPVTRICHWTLSISRARQGRCMLVARCRLESRSKWRLMERASKSSAREVTKAA